MENSTKIKVGILPSYGLGDALVNVILAESLVKNNYTVTFFSNILSKLDHWFQLVDCHKLPDSHILPDVFSQYDILLFSEEILYRFPVSFFDSLRTKIIFYKWGGLGVNSHILPYYQECRANEQTDIGVLFKLLGVNITHHDMTKTVADNVAHICKDRLHLNNVSKHPSLNLPAVRVKNLRQIIIHPDSSNKGKNWSPRKYLKLAQKLRDANYDVVFSVSPAEHDKWSGIINNKFALVQWSLEELAKALYQCRLFVGSDSGPGHLASLLGAPTVTVFPRKRSYYTWRPGWSYGCIAFPSIPLSIFKGKNHLRSPLSVRSVMAICKKVLTDTVYAFEC